MTASRSVVRGQNIKLLCSASGLPTPHVVWTRLSDHLIEGNGSVVLSLNNVTTADQGIYRCTANNSQGQTNATLNLAVEGRYSNSFTSLVCKEIDDDRNDDRSH